MANGTQRRLAIFTCLKFAPYGREYIDTSAAAGPADAGPEANGAEEVGTANGYLDKTVEQIAARFGQPRSSDSVGAFIRNQYQFQGYHEMVAFKGSKSVVVSFAKKGMTVDDATSIVDRAANGEEFQPEPPGRFHILSSDNADLEVMWTWRKNNPGLKRAAAFSPRESILVFMDGGEWVEFFNSISASKR
jgi:hypothetical protein